MDIGATIRMDFDEQLFLESARSTKAFNTERDQDADYYGLTHLLERKVETATGPRQSCPKDTLKVPTTE